MVHRVTGERRQQVVDVDAAAFGMIHRRLALFGRERLGEQQIHLAHREEGRRSCRTVDGVLLDLDERILIHRLDGEVGNRQAAAYAERENHLPLRDVQHHFGDGPLPRRPRLRPQSRCDPRNQRSKLVDRRAHHLDRVFTGDVLPVRSWHPVIIPKSVSWKETNDDADPIRGQ